MNYTDKQIEALISGIEMGTIDEWNLPTDYYRALTDYLQRGVFKGFGATLDTVSKLDLPLLEELCTNTYMFGAAKTFQEVQHMSSLLVDKDTGEVRSSNEFRKLAKEVYGTYNDDYLRTEYNTAIAQADAAAKWNDIERNKDVLPNLRYSAIGDACTICAPLDGLVAPVNSSIWDKIAPTNHFNCKCLLLQEDEDVPLTENAKDIVDPVVQTMKDKGQDIFINNVGKTGEIFTSDHPYFNVAKEYREWAKENFGLELPKFAEQE